MKRTEVRNANMGAPREIQVDFAAAGPLHGASKTRWNKPEPSAELPCGKEAPAPKKE